MTGVTGVFSGSTNRLMNFESFFIYSLLIMSTLASRIQELTTEGYFVAKLLSYEEDDYCGIISQIQSEKANEC